MHTRCPGCHTVHPVNAALLSQGDGQYRCGKCNKINNALDALFDGWPEPGDRPHARGQLPVLGVAISMDESEQDAATPEEEALLGDDAPRTGAKNETSRLSKRLWIAAAVVLALVTVINLAGLFGQPLIQHPTLQSALVSLGISKAPPEPARRDLSQLQLVSRDMQSQGSGSGTLLLSLTLVNRAQRAQPFPGLEVILIDLDGQPMASRLFQAREYLPADADLQRGMIPDAYLPIALELADPGEQAVGFEVNFK